MNVAEFAVMMVTAIGMGLAFGGVVGLAIIGFMAWKEHR